VHHDHFDIFGDIHGQAGKLERLFRVLGYEKIGGVYGSADRKAVFVGDLIDSGPAIGETLEIVKAMVDAGSGICAMGNHELNALAFHTPDGTGSHIRPHTKKNIRQHAKTLQFFASRPGAQQHYLKWFWSLPLWLDFQGLRVVHAAWDQGMIDWLFTPALTPACLALTASRSSEEFGCLDGLLKGIEIELPEGVTYSDREGQKRSSIQIKWWVTPAPGLTYRSYVFPTNDVSPDIPIAAEMIHNPYPKQGPPVISGHYWLPFGAPHSPLAANVAWADFSAGAEGPLAPYRWDGESQVDSAKFVFSD
jgi:Calcineurin-like phosphoesterase